MQAVAIARCVTDGQIAVAGTGLPLIGMAIAKRFYAAGCHVIVESGLMDCAPPEVPTSVGDNRLMTHCAVQWPNARYVGFLTNEWLHGRERLLAFIGGAQIDPFGNVNSTVIGDYAHPDARFSGSGGANGIATFANTIIMMQHEKRRFVERVDYVTSPGWVDGPGGRARAGLPEDRGPQAVITDRGVLRFDNGTKRMYLEGFFETSSPEDVRANTGFDLDVSRAVLIPPPEPEVLHALRALQGGSV
ncbi:MAG: CoA-transferase subunit beta [Clostridiales Family XIII bacterium]|jgi:glutaconate CoA-transferase subunit B|nr:CoA-transferase subunit beta [Clostridiales Family XIII bacterium]